MENATIERDQNKYRWLHELLQIKGLNAGISLLTKKRVIKIDMNIILDNQDNDKRISAELPIVPRIGDWIRVDEVEFAEGNSLVTVVNVILYENEIIVVVTAI